MTKSKLSDPCADGPGADERELAPSLANALHLVGQCLQLRAVERAVRPGKNVGTDLDHDGMSQRDDFLTNGIDHCKNEKKDQKAKQKADTNVITIVQRGGSLTVAVGAPGVNGSRSRVVRAGVKTLS